MHTVCLAWSRLINAIHNIFKCNQLQEKALQKCFEINKKSPPKIMIIMSVMAISKKLLIKVFFEMDIIEIIIFQIFYIYIYF